MALESGARLGPYEIAALIGVGGMGEVYRARDTALGRDVAIKILPASFSTDAMRVMRFQQEAKTLASLNHSNIAHIYGLERSASDTAIVMELVDGTTLMERIAQGPLPLEEALRIARQLADALEAAHERGVVHRDLKPANIKLRSDGTVKVLDFGIAKALDANATGATPATQTGVVLGTPAYMSPEQARGKSVDKRADIWAFGCLLYEMLSGRPAFEDDDVTLKPASSRESSASVDDLASVPSAVRRTIKLCLEPDVRKRIRDIGDARLALEGAFEPPVSPASRSVRGRWVWPTAFTIAALAAIALGIVFIFLRNPPDERPVQFGLPLDHTAYADIPRVSPDGSAIVYTAVDPSGKRQLWLRPLDSDNPKPVAGTDDALYPFWSPDGRWIGFYAQQKLKKINREGGSAETIVALPAFDGTAAWSATNEILYAPGNRAPLYRISDKGGTPQQVTMLDAARGENSHRLVRFLPDGKHFLFVARCTNRENNALYSGALDSGEVQRVAPIQSSVAYAPPSDGRSGMLIYARESMLYRQPFDGATLSGEAVPLTDVSYRPIGLQAFFDLSLDGTVLLSQPPYATEENLVWFDRKGVKSGGLGPAGTFEQPQISPDGNRVVFNRPDDNGGNRDVWIIETARGTASRLTVTEANEWSAIWAPDSRRIAFASDRNGHRDGATWEKTSMDPGAQESAIEGLPEWANPADWSADGKWIAFVNGAVHGDIWIAPMFGDHKPFRFFDSGFEDRDPHFSPDGKWIAYSSNESGRFETYVRPFEGKPAESGKKIQISLQGGFYPTWNRNGKELFYLGPDSKLYVAPLANLGNSEALSLPQPLFTACSGNTPTGSATQGSGFDVSPDGLKFLFVCSNEMPNKYTVTVNWSALK